MFNTAVGDAKQRQMAGYTLDENASTPLTTYWGAKIAETDLALRAGARGPTVLEGRLYFHHQSIFIWVVKLTLGQPDFHNREKISKFDHERIPERAVHARGAGAFGEFKLHTPLTGVTSAKVGLGILYLLCTMQWTR